ncbi:MAG TPA: hypothetical protein VGK25_13340 [Ignavibacteria bacterium]|jgi:hypothetical protein
MEMGLESEKKDYKQNLIMGAKSNLFEFAKNMRKKPTDVENLLWERLRRKALVTNSDDNIHLGISSLIFIVIKKD